MIRSACALLSAVCCLVSAARAGTSNSLMDVSPDGPPLLLVTADTGTVSIVATQARKVLAEVKAGDKPEGGTWIGQGPLAAVTVYREDTVVFLDADKGQVIKRLSVGNEPYGIVSNKDGSRAWVTQEYPGIVTEIDLKSQNVLRTIKAGAFLRGIAVSPDEQRLYVTEFYSAALHAIDLKSGKVVDSWKGHSTDNLCRHVVLHPRRPKAYLSHIRSKIGVIDGGGSIFPHLTIYDTVPPNGTRRHTSIALDTYNGVYVTTNPWETALSPDGKRLYTVYARTDDMNVSRVLDDDYKEIEPLGFPVQVGKNPRAVRVSPDGQTVYILNALDFTVSFYDAEGMRRLDSVKVCEPPKSPEWVRGKVLSSSAKYPMSARRWVACASCHPDGHSDGRVWQNPEGKRKTP